MNYPTGIKKSYKKVTTYDNRGMTLEEDINITNEYYLKNNIACIYKKPTPIGIVKVDYKNGNDVVIKEAYFKTPSTTDYNGIYKGKYIDFEAKETMVINFPLANIHEHQIKHLDIISKMGGIGFLIVSFVKVNEIYVLSNEKLQEFLNTNKRKSIPLEYFRTNGYKIDLKYNLRLDYIKIVDKLIEGEKYEYKNN
jgi:recombination protein U